MPYKHIAFQQTALTKVPKFISCKNTFINGHLKKCLAADIHVQSQRKKSFQLTLASLDRKMLKSHSSHTLSRFLQGRPLPLGTSYFIGSEHNT